MLEEIVVTFDYIKEHPDYWKIFKDKDILQVIRNTHDYISFLVMAA